jgi:hypothetical protein
MQWSGTRGEWWTRDDTRDACSTYVPESETKMSVFTNKCSRWEDSVKMYLRKVNSDVLVRN